ncbi:hypothetical protein BFP72_10795 [Reichenbachiella sp. 5M10]|uniref:DUF3575 domain-containing protein n=1 Tax=Reichenbachiella sp. 5M10 TaxID=1889772 RepID=UPI000C15E44B|nr:DUF3575 domain-containing protein [Reichenbachiella sp. 5M10]PIB35845.1 hypothetical protein BFP72_10795 [Reichenbachiella sp. 5M10]
MNNSSLKYLGVSILLFLASRPQASAQQDFQINLSNLIFYEANMNYEFLSFDGNATLGAFGGYVYGFPGNNEDQQYYYVGPELRFYPFPNRGADGFFLGLYSRYKNGYKTQTITESGYTSGGDRLNENTELKVDYEKLAFGFNLGMKWVTRSNVILSFNTGLGRIAYYDYHTPTFQSSIENLVDPITYEVYTDDNTIDSKYWDFRIGFNIGYRFGTSKIKTTD